MNLELLKLVGVSLLCVGMAVGAFLLCLLLVRAWVAAFAAAVQASERRAMAEVWAAIDGEPSEESPPFEPNVFTQHRGGGVLHD